MLGRVHPGRQRVCGVFRKYRDGIFEKNRATIVFFRHEVHRDRGVGKAAGTVRRKDRGMDAVAVKTETAELRQGTRMDVDGTRGVEPGSLFEPARERYPSAGVPIGNLAVC